MATWTPIAAGVEWHAGHRGFERPAAVHEGRVRVEVTVEATSSVGPPLAGSPAWRIFIARDGTGRRLRIRVDGEGRTQVEAESG